MILVAGNTITNRDVLIRLIDDNNNIITQFVPITASVSNYNGDYQEGY
jgi:hypothetical protein